MEERVGEGLTRGSTYLRERGKKPILVYFWVKQTSNQPIRKGLIHAENREIARKKRDG